MAGPTLSRTSRGSLLAWADRMAQEQSGRHRGQGTGDGSLLSGAAARQGVRWGRAWRAPRGISLDNLERPGEHFTLRMERQCISDVGAVSVEPQDAVPGRAMDALASRCGGGTRAFVFSGGLHQRRRPAGGTSQAGCPGQPLSVGHSGGARKPFLQGVDA